MTTLSLFGQNIPVCGGGYMRLLPTWVHTAAIQQMNNAGQPAVIYMHPYELAIDEVKKFARSGFKISRKRYLMQSLWRAKLAHRLERLAETFAFDSIHRCLGQVAPARGNSMTSTLTAPKHIVDWASLSPAQPQT